MQKGTWAKVFKLKYAKALKCQSFCKYDLSIRTLEGKGVQFMF